MAGRTSGRLLGPIWADRAPQDAPGEPRGAPKGPTAPLLGCKMVAQGLPTQQKTGRDETKTRQDKTSHDKRGQDKKKTRHDKTRTTDTTRNPMRRPGGMREAVK